MDLFDVLACTGALVIALGVGMIYPPAGVIALGVSMLVAGVLGAVARGRAEGSQS